MQKLGELLLASGLTIYPLILFSIVIIALAIGRIRFWYPVKRNQKSVVRSVLALYRDDPDLAIDKLKQNLDQPVARVFLEALRFPMPPQRNFGWPWMAEPRAKCRV